MSERDPDLGDSEPDFAELRWRLHRLIPGGAHTYSRGDDQYPAVAPPVLERGRGAYVWDTHGNRYLDYGMALRAVTLGYAHPAVNAAAVAEIEKGVNLTRASTTELRAAELVCETVPTADMVKFAKNGSNVTTAAVKVARAYTGRRYVCVPRQHPFFSFDDWFIGTTPVKRGVAIEQAAATLLFDYNDIDSLRQLFEAHPGQIAAVMLEPATHVTPLREDRNGGTFGEGYDAAPRLERNFLHAVQDLARAKGALFILDEMITGFRWRIDGAQAYFGVEPDLSTFGKAMANGFSLAALVGRREVMEVGAIDKPGMERTFLLSTTHGGEMPPLGAFIEATRVNREEGVSEHLWSYGKRLRGVFEETAARHGLEVLVTLEGPAVALNYVTRDADGNPSAQLRTLFSQEMLRHGVMMPWIAFSLAHGEAELERTAQALDRALEVYARALDEGVNAYLVGSPIKPVFRTHN